MTQNIAVIDIGKTNAKLALVDAETLTEVAVVTRPNTVLPGPPWPHFDLEGHWQFFLHHLAQFHAEHGINAISITTHGAAGVLLDAAGNLAAPMLDYEHPGPDTTRDAYNRIRPAFAQTGSARLPMGLNLGAQLHWMLDQDPGLRARTAHVLTYPQYWAFRLTGALATDVTSLGCHTDLWDPWEGRFTDLPATLGLGEKFAAPQRPDHILGHIRAEIAAATGLPPDTPVTTGIHDSNASLLPHLMARTGAFSVVSTGTWVVSMAVGGQRLPLDPARDLLVNTNALGQPVPSARFMGGREFDTIRAGSDIRPTPQDRAKVLSSTLMLLPSVQQGSGPFPARQMRWTKDPATEGQKLHALSLYLALMTDTCLTLIGAEGPVIVEGPFARNRDYLEMLAALRPGGVEIAASATGTSIGAALLCLPNAAPPATSLIPAPPDTAALRAYAEAWREKA